MSTKKVDNNAGKSNTRSGKLSLSSYWSNPIPGGFDSATVEFIAVSRYTTEAQKGGGKQVIKAVTEQLTFAGKCPKKRIEIYDDTNLWPKFSNKRETGESGPK